MSTLARPRVCSRGEGSRVRGGHQCQYAGANTRHLTRWCIAYNCYCAQVLVTRVVLAGNVATKAGGALSVPGFRLVERVPMVPGY